MLTTSFRAEIFAVVSDSRSVSGTRASVDCDKPRWTGEFGLWGSFIVLTVPPLLWPRAVLGLSSMLELVLVLYLLKTGNLAPTCTYK